MDPYAATTKPEEANIEETQNEKSSEKEEETRVLHVLVGGVV